MKRILVTGGAGYIGSHACKVLAAAGYEPVTYDNLVFGHPWAVRWGPLEEGDIADQARLDRVFARYRPDAVMHFAAFAYIGESMTNPGKYYRNNVAGTLSLLEAMLRHGTDKIAFSSSCAVYGRPQAVPMAEDHPREPINPYGASKFMVERMLRDFDLAHGIRSISLRYFNAAGADPEGELGEEHDPETHLIPLVLDVAAGARKDVTINGDDYETPDGTCVRDYIHATDLADAHILALKALENGAETTAYNLGNGQGYSVKEVIEKAAHVTGRQVPHRVGPRRPGDPPILLADGTRAKKELGWQPRYANLDEIINTAWRWHQNRLEATRIVKATNIS